MQIVKVPFINAMGKTKGCEKAPEKILDELKNIGSNEKGNLINFKDLKIEELKIDVDNIEEANFVIYENAKEIIGKNFKYFFIGGDHSISYPILKAFKKLHKNPLLIVFDSHADCVEPGKEPTHEEWLRKAVDDFFNPKDVIIISVRNMWKEEIDYIKEKGITLIKMDILQEDLNEVCDIVMERARKADGFYISIDIDSVDPGFAPGTGYLEPGGLSSRDLIYFIKRLVLLNNFKGGDLVEINPLKDINNMTVKLGAKIISEVL